MPRQQEERENIWWIQLKCLPLQRHSLLLPEAKVRMSRLTPHNVKAS